MTDLAGREHWDNAWEHRSLPSAIDPDQPGWWNEPNRRLHGLIADAVSLLGSRRGEALEIGCAGSAWLPYLASRHQLEVTGIDYSELGCRQARAVLARSRVPGSIVCADVFSPPGMHRAFDLVVSLGVAEHFEQTDDCIQTFSEFMARQGVIVTVVPNLTGAIGRLQRWLDPDLLAKHVPLSATRLAEAHLAAGLRVHAAGYLMAASWNICGLGADRSTRVRLAAKRGLDLASRAVWAFERRVGPLPAPRLASAYVFVVAVRP